MKLMKLVVGLMLAFGMLGLTGCKKKSGTTGPDLPPMEVEGVKVELPKLVNALNTANQDAQSSARNVQLAFRYRQFEKALMEMDKLSSDTTLTDDQKKLVAEVLEQVKQVVAKAPPAPQ